MMELDFRDRMRRQRTEELVRISDSSSEDGFEPEAIRAAREELASRGLSVSDLAEMQDEALALNLYEAGAVERPLGNGFRGLFLVFGPFLIFSLFGLFVFYALSTRGYRRMAREAFNASAVGLLLWMSLIGLAFWLFD